MGDLDGGDFLVTSRDIPLFATADYFLDGGFVEKMGFGVFGARLNFHPNPGQSVIEFKIFVDFVREVAVQIVESDHVTFERSFVIGRNFPVVQEDDGFLSWK